MAKGGAFCSNDPYAVPFIRALFDGKSVIFLHYRTSRVLREVEFPVELRFSTLEKNTTY